MGLLQLCFLPLLSAQDPAPVPVRPGSEAVTRIAVPSAVETAPIVNQGGERERLLAAERAGQGADVAELRALADADDVAVAARAAWLLGRHESRTAIDLVREVARTSRHVEARQQAMHALLKDPEVGSLTTAVHCLGDADVGVRTLAAQLLAVLRRPAAIAPLVQLIERGPRTDGAATDVQAALVALRDLGAADQLLRIATALDDRPAAGVGQALTWCFQGLSPRLESAAQATLLVAVLGHHEPLLRRYAIGRLGELRQRSTAQALEGRLATEAPELRPLVELALAQVRGDDKPKARDELERAMQNAKALFARLEARWASMPMQDRVVAGAIGVSLLMVLVIVAQLRRRRHRAETAAATLALVAPSEEHLEQLAAEAEAEAEELAAAAEAEAFADDGGYAEDGYAEEGAETDGWGEPIADDGSEYAEEPGVGHR